MKTAWLVMLAAPLAIACSSSTDGDGDSTPIADGPLAGNVGGKLWSFQAGQTDAFLSEGEPNFFAEAYAEATAACSTAFPSLDYLLLNVPRQPGSYEISLSFSQTFYVQATNENLVATSGHMVIDEVTSTTIGGGAYIHFDPQNSVNGHFQLAVCP